MTMYELWDTKYQCFIYKVIMVKKKKICEIVEYVNEDYQLLKIVDTLDEANTIVKQHQMSKYRTYNLSNLTNYWFRCSHCRKYPLCRYEI